MKILDMTQDGARVTVNVEGIEHLITINIKAMETKKEFKAKLTLIVNKLINAKRIMDACDTKFNEWNGMVGEEIGTN